MKSKNCAFALCLKSVFEAAVRKSKNRLHCVQYSDQSIKMLESETITNEKNSFNYKNNRPTSSVLYIAKPTPGDVKLNTWQLFIQQIIIILFLLSNAPRNVAPLRRSPAWTGLRTCPVRARWSQSPCTVALQRQHTVSSNNVFTTSRDLVTVRVTTCKDT